MAGPIDIYDLVRFANEAAGCVHHLLLKVTQAEYPNWNETKSAIVHDEMTRRRDQLIESFRSQMLPQTCPHAHHAEIVGEFQDYPLGDVFYEGGDHPVLDIWVASTKYGSHWIVLGVADSEEDFWRQVAENEDLISLGPIPPARQVRVHFLNRAGEF
ncbi:hypothetical protein [Zavarzinella formosa]|uniref:hypothetical protein n=1 Tax=Zavarzinella formosa TaxID=360055 RepID=UPI0002E5DEA2|nr:hypothetical protein [Zavarzinella formosa]